MSGIAVIMARAGQPIVDSVVDSVADALAHRGPDGLVIKRLDTAVIIHAALLATPEARVDDQPFQGPDGTWYVGDLRLDNRSELMKHLGTTRGTASRSTHEPSDIELIAAAHRRWGSRFANHLLGDFAVVAVQPDQQLLCVRDQLGVKALYHWVSPRWAVVASGLREVTAHPEAPSVLDLQMAGEYLTGWVEDDTKTVVAGVERLPAANALCIATDRVRRFRYWDAPLDQTTADDAAIAEEFTHLLRESVRSRLRAPGPVGCELTGGLDSTSVAGTAAGLIKDRSTPATALRTYSCLFPGSPRSDERSYIDTAVGDLDLSWRSIISETNRDPWVDSDVRYWSDIPLPPDGPDHVLLGRTAAIDGCKVVLTGHGGDNWFDTSHLALADMVARTRLDQAWALAGRWSGGAPHRRAMMLFRQGISSAKPDWLHRPGATRAPWVIGEARRAAALDQRRVPGRRPRVYRTRAGHWHHQILLDGYEAMTKEVLDRTGARAGVEARHPYLDRRLVEFACRVPITAHTTVTTDRALQRAGLRGIMPERIVERTTKASFAEVWNREIARQLPVEDLGTTPAAHLGWIDDRLVKDMWHTTEASVRAGGGGKMVALWGVVQVNALLGHLDPPAGY